MGDALRILGDADGSSAYYQTALTQAESAADEMDSTQLATRAWCLYKLGRFDEAMRVYGRAMTVDEDEVSTQFDMALALLHNGRRGLAVQEYQRGVKMARQKHPWEQRGSYLVALRDLREVLDEAPSVAETAESGECRQVLEEAMSAIKERPID